MRILRILIAIFAVAVIASGQVNSDIGTTGFAFLKIGMSAREVAMGGASVGLTRDVNAIFWNPAGIARLTQAQAGLSYLNYVADIQSGFLGYAKPSGRFGWGAGISYLNSGAIKKTDVDNIDLGSFVASFASFNFAGGYKISDKLLAGATVKFLYAGIDTFKAVAAGIDLGATFFTPYQGLKTGLVVQNLGSQLKAFVQQNDPLPLAIGVGVGYELRVFDLALDLVKPLDSGIIVKFGSEWWVHQNLCFRLGYNSSGSALKTGGGSDILGGFSTGLGIRYKNIGLDYAYTPYLALGNGHRISLSFQLQ
jgi:hypothetical protein